VFTCLPGMTLVDDTCTCPVGEYFEVDEDFYPLSVCQACDLSFAHLSNLECQECTWNADGFDQCTKCKDTHFLDEDHQCVLESC